MSQTKRFVFLVDVGLRQLYRFRQLGLPALVHRRAEVAVGEFHKVNSVMLLNSARVLIHVLQVWDSSRPVAVDLRAKRPGNGHSRTPFPDTSDLYGYVV